MRLLLSIVSILFLSVLACYGQAGSKRPAKAHWDSKVWITMYQGPCYGSCSEYEIKIWSNGRVQFNGVKFTKVHGRITAKLNRQQVEQIRSEIETAKFFDLQDTYNERTCPNAWTDDSTITLSINSDGRKKTISHYQGCAGEDAKGIDRNNIYPRELSRLERLIEEVVGSRKWSEREGNR